MLGRALTEAARARYTHVDSVDAARARVVVVPWLQPGVAAMTLGRFVLVRRGNEQRADLIAHELVHVAQWREFGIVRFLTRYLGDYARARRTGMGHWDAYRAISLEVDARERSGY